jgi:hypothetical protein
METSMLSMHHSKVAMDIQNHEKQMFCEQLKRTQQRIDATLNNFFASMDRKSIS